MTVFYLKYNDAMHVKRSTSEPQFVSVLLEQGGGEYVISYLTPDQAREIADELIETANMIEKTE